jgi:CheY-like chemotaxis protein
MFREARVLEFPKGSFAMPRANILVIEDNPSDIFLLRRALIAAYGENFSLEIVPDGERALELIQSPNGNRPCAILLDLHIPKHDGLEILRALRQSPELNHIHVLITTNGASPQEQAELRRMGVDYRLKPKDLAEFATLASDLMKICNRSAASL